MKIVDDDLTCPVVYYNTTGDQKCFNINEGASAGLGDASWNYQACTELVLPVSSNGVNGKSNSKIANESDLTCVTQICF